MADDVGLTSVHICQHDEKLRFDCVNADPRSNADEDV